MYLGCRVKIPRDGGNITVKTINGTPYVYIERGRSYSKEKKYSIPKRTCIGKRDSEQPDFILNFLYILTLSQPEGFRLPRYYQSTYSELVTNFNIHRR